MSRDITPIQPQQTQPPVLDIASLTTEQQIELAIANGILPPDFQRPPVQQSVETPPLPAQFSDSQQQVAPVQPQQPLDIASLSTDEQIELAKANGILPQDFQKPFRLGAPERRGEFAEGFLNLAPNLGKIVTGAVAGLGRVGSGLIQRATELGVPTETIFRGILSRVRPDLAEEFEQLSPDDVIQATGAVAKELGVKVDELGTPAQIGQFIGEIAPALAVPARGLITGGIAGGAVAGAAVPVEDVTTTRESAQQALLQTGGGAALGAAAGTLLRGAQAALPLVRRVISDIAASPLRAIKGKDADRFITERINTTDAAGTRELANQLRQSEVAILPDIAGNEVQALTRTVGSVVGGARNTITEFLTGRGGEQAVERVRNILARDISKVDTYFGNLDDVAKLRAETAAPLYAKAYEQGKNINRVKINKLLEDQRIIDALDEGKRTFGVRLEANANSLEALDGVKKVLDDKIGVALRTGAPQRAAAFGKLKQQLVEELDKASPIYKKARKVFSDFSSMESAQKLGNKFNTFRPEQVRRIIKDFSPSEKQAFKIGVRENLEKVIGDTRRTGSPADRIFNTPNQKQRLEAIFDNKTEFKAFERKMKEEIQEAQTRNFVLGGSQTDKNLASNIDFLKEVAIRFKQGETFGDKLMNILGLVGRAVADQYRGITKKTSQDIANILTDRNASIELLERLAVQQESPIQKGLIRNIIDDLSEQLNIAPAIGGATAVTTVAN